MTKVELVIVDQRSSSMSLRYVVRIKRRGHRNAEGSGLSVVGRYFTGMTRVIISLLLNLPLKGPQRED
jgi:hypothetical protein